MRNWENCQAVERHPDRVSGAWVFRGTRVPVAALFENLRDGASIEKFLYPRLTRPGVMAALEFAARALKADAVYPLEAQAA